MDDEGIFNVTDDINSIVYTGSDKKIEKRLNLSRKKIGISHKATQTKNLYSKNPLSTIIFIVFNILVVIPTIYI